MIVKPGGAGSDGSNETVGGSTASGIDGGGLGGLVALSAPFPSSAVVAPVHAKNAAILVDGFEMTNFLNEYDVSFTTDVAETTPFQPAGDAKQFILGIKSGTISATGFYDGGVGLIADQLAAMDTAAVASNSFLAFPTGGKATNSACWLAAGVLGKIEYKSPLTGVTTCAYSATASGDEVPLLHGWGQVDITAVASGNGQVCDIGRVPTAGNVGVLAITANTRDAGSISVQLQYSTDGSTWASFGDPLALNAGVANVGSALCHQSGANGRYFRVVVTVTGGTTGSYSLSYAYAPY